MPSRFSKKSNITLRKSSPSLNGGLEPGAKGMENFLDTALPFWKSEIKEGTFKDLELKTARPELKHAIEKRFKAEGISNS
tara:strand:- start:135 stop:374 length:240 start_codon:yes stop_codon:yes gene_type:complete